MFIVSVCTPSRLPVAAPFFLSLFPSLPFFEPSPPDRSAWTRSPRWTPPKRARSWGKCWGGSAKKSATTRRCSGSWACRLLWRLTWWKENRPRSIWKSKSWLTMTPRLVLFLFSVRFVQNFSCTTECGRTRRRREVNSKKAEVMRCNS